MNIKLKVNENCLIHCSWKYFGENTIYEKIYKLEPGNIISFYNGKFSKKKYLQNTDTNLSTLDLIKRIVSEWSVSDVKVGALLSGGLDSSLICKFLSLFSKKKISLFTAYFENSPKSKFNNDFKKSKFLKKKINFSKHFLIPINNSNLKYKIDKLIDHTLEPVHDFNSITFMDICSYIKRNTNLKVIFTGDGADEIFGGYQRHQYIKKSTIIKKY